MLRSKTYKVILGGTRDEINSSQDIRHPVLLSDHLLHILSRALAPKGPIGFSTDFGYKKMTLALKALLESLVISCVGNPKHRV